MYVPPPPPIPVDFGGHGGAVCQQCQAGAAPGQAVVGGSAPGYAVVGGPMMGTEPAPIGTISGRYAFAGDSDATIVRGLIAILKALYTDVPLGEVAAVDASAELARLGLDSHLSAQRSNGLRAMVQRIRETAAESVGPAS